MNSNCGDLTASRLKHSHAQAFSNYQKNIKKSSQFFKYNYLKHLSNDRTAPILDIGAGLGEFVAFCVSEGYINVEGIELSNDNVEFCKEHDLPIKHADAHEFLPSSDKLYQTIVMNDVIEHLTKPQMWDILALIESKLMPGGKVIIKTFNMANPIMGLNGRYLDITHETGWTEQSMTQVLEASGFKDIAVYPSNLYVYYNNPLNYVAAAIEKCISCFLWLYFRMNARHTTKIFTKNLIGIGSKISLK